MRNLLCTLVMTLTLLACQEGEPAAPDASTDDLAIDDWEDGADDLAPDDDETHAIANQAGCDVVGGSCGAQGACCDTHDDCIDRNCPPGMGSVLTCNPVARLFGRCPPACAACHDAVVDCFSDCNTNPNAPGCGPSACCGEAGDPDDDTCGEEQACYDRTGATPELISDPCECERREIDLSPSPPRPAGHCCEETGWGCCQGEGAAVPGPGGGGCCAGLQAKDGRCVAPSGSGSGSGSGS